MLMKSGKAPPKHKTKASGSWKRFKGHEIPFLNSILIDFECRVKCTTLGVERLPNRLKVILCKLS